MANLVPDNDMPDSIVPADDLPSAAAAAPAAAPNAPEDPTAGAGTPEEKYTKYYGYGPRSQDDAADFMAHPPHRPTLTEAAQMVGGLPRAAAGFVAAPVSGAASAGAHLAGAVMAPLAGDRAGEVLQNADERAKRWSENVSKLADYVPTGSEVGDQTAEALLSAPGNLIKGTLGAGLKAALPDNEYQLASDIAGGVGTDVMAFGVPGLTRMGIRGGKAAAGAAADVGRAAKGAYEKGYNANPPEPLAPKAAPTPPVGTPVTGASLRAQPNPIPPPDDTVAAAKSKANAAAAEEPSNGAGTMPFGHESNPATTAATGGTRPAAAPLSSNPERGSVRVTREDSEGKLGFAPGFAPLFVSPKDEGPQETPRPEEQAQRQQHLNDINDLSGGALPKVRDSAVSGDYNATGKDWQDKQTGVKGMESQIASENNAMHTAMQDVHDSVGSEFGNGVDNTTLENRGRVTRGAIQAIEQHFNDATDGVYQVARANTSDAPMPKFLQRAKDFLSDDANYMPDGFRRSAQARLQQLETRGDAGIRGDGTDAAAPSSIGAAEKFREWLNKNRTLDNMHTTRQLVDHTDADVAEHGGPGLFKAARNLRRHAAQLLEEPDGIRKLLAPEDSQGINHKIKEGKVMDYIADLDRGQHEHVLNVLRSAAHLGDGELAERSAQAIREIQAHTVSRLHEAAKEAGGKWNARTFYAASERYGKNARDTFKDRPDVIKNLQTINRAGNTLAMDRNYPGAVGQGMQATGLGHVVEAGGRIAGALAHDIPVVGRLVGRAIEGGVEGLGGKMSEAAREKAVASRIRDNERGSVKVGLPTMEEFMKGGGKERGSMSFNDIKQPEPGQPTPSVRLSGSPQGVTAYSANGSTGAIRRGNDLHVRSSETAPEGRNKGEGNARLVTLADRAHADGGKLHSDNEVSEPEQRRYNALRAQGYDVKENPHTTDPGTGVKKSASELKGVYEVGPKAPLGQRIPGMRGAAGDVGKQSTAGMRSKQGGGPREMHEDVRANNHMAIYPTEAGFGSGGGVTGSDVAKHVKDTSTSISDQSVKDLLGKNINGNYKKVDVPLDKVDADTPISTGVVKRYAERNTPFPAIVTDSDGKVVDGNHRVAAARMRGDTTIPAYVPEEPHPLMEKAPLGQRIPGMRGAAGDVGKQSTAGMRSKQGGGPSGQRGSVRVMNPGGGEQTKLPAFKKWFGESKIAEEDGTPKVVYHGTNKPFNEFDAKNASSKTGNPNAQLGHFFSESPVEASRYSADWGKADGHVMPVYLSVKNPYSMPYKEFNDLSMGAWKHIKGGETKEQLAKLHDDARSDAVARRMELEKQGHDGIVTRVGGMNEYIAFKPHQIKSAIGNSGKFSRKNADITAKNESTQSGALA